MSLRRRLFIRVFVPVALVYFAVGLLGAFHVRSVLIDNLDDDLRLAANGSSAVLEALTTDQIGLALAQRNGTPTPRLSAIVDVATGEVLLTPSSRFGQPEPGPAAERFAPGRLVDGIGEPFVFVSEDGSLDYRAVTTRIDGGRLFVLAEPLDRINDVFGALLFGIATTGLVILGALAAVLYLTVRASLRPLDAFVATTTEIAEGDLSRRIWIKTSDPISVRMGTATNHMLDRVEAGYVEQRQSRGRLHGLINDASHELRTPLTGIRGAVDMQRMGMVASDEAIATTFAQLDHHSARMVEVVEDLLVIARVEQGIAEQRRSGPIDAITVVSTAVDAARWESPERLISMHMPDTPAMVELDEGLLRQAIDEVVSNAVRHTPADAAIDVITRVDGDEVVISIVDHGCGIPPELWTPIFDRFVRIDASRDRASGGSGLGLAIARSICEASGGSVEVTSSGPSGTTFELRLPTAVERPDVSRPGPTSVSATGLRSVDAAES